MAPVNLPVNKAFRTIGELTDLVKAIRDSPEGTQEANWVEWKGPVDLSVQAGKFILARGILAFANRSPDVARRACEGVAYMIAGVEPGTVHGIAMIDHADLEKGVARFVGGPRWTPYYVDGEPGKKVLVITIEPPQWGDRIHTLQRTFDKYELGEIFHREGAKSQKARPRDIAMLEDRLLRGVQDPAVDLRLTMEDPESFARMFASEDAIADWIDRRRESLKKRVPPKPPPRPPEPSPPAERPSLAGLAGIWDSPAIKMPEFRFPGLSDMFSDDSHAEFRKRVDEHLKICRRRLVANARATICKSRMNKLRFRVQNPTDGGTASVVVTARFSCPDVEVFTGIPSADRLPPPPKWPGPADNIMNRVGLGPVVQHGALAALAGAASVRRSGDVVEIEYTIGNLGPGQVKLTPAVTVIPGLDAPAEFDIELTGHSMNRRGRTSARITALIADQGWPLDQLVEDAACD